LTGDHEPVVGFDHHTPEFGEDAHRKFADLRARCPMAFSESYDGFWVASTYDTARKVLSDDRLFTVVKSADGTKGGKLIPTSKYAPSVVPGVLDGEEHDRLRRPLRVVFSKAYIERVVEPIARRVADDLLDELVGLDEFDFVDRFSFPMTVDTIFEFVGLDVADRQQFILMLEGAFAIDPEAGGDRDTLALQMRSQFAEASAHVRAVARDRMEHPRTDLMSHMTAPAAGLDEDDVVSLTLSMVLGGVRTTAASLDHIMLQLDADHELRAALTADPSLIPQAVEELTRISAVTPLVARTALADVDLGGVTIHEGDRIAALIASANLDEHQFPDGGAVKLDRRDGLSLTFGVGTHHCLGIWLAKMELRVAVEAILRRMPEFRVARDRVRRYRLVGVNNGFASLPVRPHVGSDVGRAEPPVVEP
jgi:cytochrome P450